VKSKQTRSKEEKKKKKNKTWAFDQVKTQVNMLRTPNGPSPTAMDTQLMWT
jgi:hypothetical protein